MQSAFIPEGQVQTFVDPGPMDYKSIMTRGYPFVPVKRVNVNDPDVNLEYEVQSRSVENGEPVVLEGFHQQEKWKASLFTFPYLQAKFGDEKILCRDLHNADDVDLTMAQYIETVHGDTLDRGSTSSSIHAHPSIPGSQDFISPRKPLIYAKDLTCPPTWRNFLMNGGLPPFLAYMRENDLNNLNTQLAAENLMVYIGQAGTWTPAHIDQCGAIGHNIMTWADTDSSSIWFMIRSKDRKKAEELWSSFNQPLDYEGYFAGLDELQRAKFPVYVVQQKIGDFVMVPSQCVHQVINLGKATIKVSWNRLTPNCLKAAIASVLPRYREIGRPEGYRIKLIIASTLKAWTEKLETQEDDFGMPKNNFCKAFKEVLELYRGIVEEEWVDMHAMGSACEPFERPKRLKESQHSQPAICDFCRADIWNRQFQCRECVDDEDAYDLCAQCYSLGRGCEHRVEHMDLVENFSMESCRLTYCRALAAWNQSTALSGCPSHQLITDTWFEKIVPSADKDFSSTTLAYMRHQFAGDGKMCHICRLKSKTQMSAECSSCPLSFCELCLYKYHDTLWTDIASKQSGWKCFRCQGVCPCTQNDKRAVAGCTPPEASHIKSLWFTRPEEDHRNHGGISDDLESPEQEKAALGEDGWNERPQIAHGSHISKWTKARSARADDMLGHSTLQCRRSLTPDCQSTSTKKGKRSRSAMGGDDGDEWRAKPKAIRGTLTKRNESNPAHADDLSDTYSQSNYRRSLLTKTQPINFRKSRTSLQPTTSEAVFNVCLGEDEEFVRTMAEKAGLPRTLASLAKLQLVPGMTTRDIVGLDKRLTSLDLALRASFREDLMDKIKQARLDEDNVTNEHVVGSQRLQKQLKEKEGSMREDGAEEAGHHSQSGDDTREKIPNKKRFPERLKDAGEATREASAEGPGHQMHSDEETHEDIRTEKQPQKRLKEREGGTREVVAIDVQESQTLLSPIKRNAVSRQHPSRTRKSGPRQPLPRSPSPGASQNQCREDEDSSSPPRGFGRSKRGQGAAVPILSKSEVKPKSPESEKKTVAPRRAMAGSKKQSGFLRGTSDILNHRWGDKGTNILGSSLYHP